MISRRGPLALALVATLCSSAGWAQNYLATTTSNVPYPGLSNPTLVPLVASQGLANDRGRATIPIGFSFPYFGRAYNAITVTANGVAFLEPSSAINQTADFSGNTSIPNATEPNGILAPFWDDLAGRNPNSRLASQSVTGANGQGLVIEWSDFNDWGPGFYSLTFQLRLWENGAVDFYYGNMNGSGAGLSATVGVEDPTGNLGTSKPCLNQCGIVPVPSAAAPDPLRFVESNQRISFGPPPGADLLVGAVKVNSVVPSAATLTLSTTVTMRNFGTVAANNFTYRLFLSTDTVYDVGIDVPFTPLQQGPFSLPALASLAHTAVSTVPRPLSGSYYVLAVLDDTNLIPETSEANNLGATANALVAGVDLVARGVIAPPLGGPGEPVSATVQYSNIGLDPAGLVAVKLYLSRDQLIDVGDRLIYSTTLNTLGGQDVDQPVTFTMPGTVTAGDYYFLLEVAPTGSVTELSTTNNVASSSTLFTLRQADLIVESVRILNPAPPYAPTDLVFLAEPIRLQATLKNVGGGNAPNVTGVFYLSDNDTVNGITDTAIGQVTGLALGPGQSTTITVTGTVPSVQTSGVPYLPGLAYIFGVALSPGLSEVTTANNFLKSDALRLRQPAPDLVALSVTGPAVLGAGEALVLTRVLGNVGNRPAPPTAYRFYLSANQIISEQDVLLPIRQADGSLRDEGTVTLAVGAQQLQSEVVVVPSGTPGGQWFLGVLLDPPGLNGVGALVEVEEGNNDLAGLPVTVIGGGLAITTTSLVDAVQGRAYSAQLAATGGNGTFAWTVAEGSSLPAGLGLSSAGELTGTATGEGVFAFTVNVSSGGKTAQARVVIRVVPVTATLSITTRSLPPLARSVRYATTLGAVGGLAPYRWALLSGTVPLGLSLRDGQLSGTASAPVGTESKFTLQVSDSLGNTDTRAFSMRVLESGQLQISSMGLPVGIVSSAYGIDIPATNVGGTALARPLSWRVVGGALPPGLLLGQSDDRALLSGTPKAQGSFGFVLEVTDALGRSDSTGFVLQVVSQALAINGAPPAAVIPGAEVTAQLSTSREVPGAKWFLWEGQLPPGLTLSPGGLISGTIPLEANRQPYNFTVAVERDGQVVALGTFAIAVSDTANTRSGCGVAGGAPGLLAALAVVLARRRRAR